MNGRRSQLLISEPPLQVLPSLAVKIGLNEALVLQQVHYWLLQSKHEHDGRLWVYNSYEGWRETNFPFWSVRTLKRVFSNLESAGLLVTGNYNTLRQDRTKWYSIDYEKLTDLEPSEEEAGGPPPAGSTGGTTMGTDWHDASGQDGTIHQDKMARPLPETNPETTHRDRFETKRSNDVATMADLITGIAQDFGDKAPEHSLQSQARRLYREADMSAEDFVQLVYAARTITRQYQGKQGAGQIENKAAYFLATLRQMLTT